jgi:hypothetical protein
MVALVPPSPAHLEGFLERAREIAAAVDRHYARLRAAVAPDAAPFDGGTLDHLISVLDPGPDHVTPLESLDQHLAGLKPEEYPRAAARDPANDLERALLRLSDLYYGLIVSTLEVWFAYENEFSGILRGRALSLMDGLDEINGALVERGFSRDLRANVVYRRGIRKRRAVLGRRWRRHRRVAGRRETAR